MQQRPRDPEPVAGQPRARDITPHWIDGITTLIMSAMITATILATAAAQR